MGKYKLKDSSNNYEYRRKPISKPHNCQDPESVTDASRYYGYRQQKKNKKNHSSIKKYGTRQSNFNPFYQSSLSQYVSSPQISSDSSSSSSSSSQSQSLVSISSATKRHQVQHFKYRKGQYLNDRYKVKKLLGDGTFGRVVQCKYDHRHYAIKVIKPVQKYINSAKVERSIIKKINSKDKNDHYGIVRYIESFYHKEHFCMVFKPLGKSLYQFLKMNNFKGFPLPIIQSFFKQILVSIGFLHQHGYTHTDLKPENILMEQTQFIESDPNLPYMYNNKKYSYGGPKKYYLPIEDKVRIIDFGGATKHDDYHSSIINTRQYRSPEIILQSIRWWEISDLWSIGCIICELYTGQLLFSAYDDREHLAMIQKNSGKYPNWMLSNIPKGHPQQKLFQDGFINQSKLPHIQNIIGMKTVSQIFEGQPELIDLIMGCLHINPNKRITCKEALKHPFFLKKFH